VIWEVLASGETPYEGVAPELISNIIVERGCVLQQPIKSMDTLQLPSDLWFVATKCWQPELERLTMTDLLLEIQQILQKSENQRLSKEHYGRGLHLKNQNLPEEAIAEFVTSIELVSDYAPVYIAMAHCQKSVGKHTEAFNNYVKAIELSPTNIYGHAALASLLHDLRRFEEAFDEYKVAIQLGPPQLAVVHTNFGVLLKDMNRFDEASNHFKEAVKLDPKDPTHYSNMGWLCCIGAKWEAADSCFSEVAKAIADSAPCVMMALSMAQTHKIQECADTLKMSDKAREALHQNLTTLQTMEKHPLGNSLLELCHALLYFYGNRLAKAEEFLVKAKLELSKNEHHATTGDFLEQLIIAHKTDK
jgi:tetratricopeptide (TPR) repeat protein